MSQPQNKEMSVFSIPFCHPSHPGNKLFMARGYERKGACEICAVGWKGGSKWEARCLEQNRDCSKDRAVKKTKFKDGHKKRGLNASGQKAQATS